MCSYTVSRPRTHVSSIKQWGTPTTCLENRRQSLINTDLLNSFTHSTNTYGVPTTYQLCARHWERSCEHKTGNERNHFYKSIGPSCLNRSCLFLKQSLLYAAKFHPFSHLSLFWACFLGNSLQGFLHTRPRTSQSSPSSSCPSQLCLFIKLPTPFWIKTKRVAFCTNREAKKCSREISSITRVSLELLKVTILSRDTQLSAKAPVCLLKCQRQTLY